MVNCGEWRSGSKRRRVVVVVASDDGKWRQVAVSLSGGGAEWRVEWRWRRVVVMSGGDEWRREAVAVTVSSGERGCWECGEWCAASRGFGKCSSSE